MDDLISRQAAIELWEEYHPYIAVKACEYGKRLRSLPSAERHGRWIPNDNSTYSCSLCQSWIPNEQHHYARYCLYCGAKMSEDDATPYTECVVNLYTETKLRFVLDKCIEDEELIEKILKALDEIEE